MSNIDIKNLAILDTKKGADDDERDFYFGIPDGALVVVDETTKPLEHDGLAWVVPAPGVPIEEGFDKVCVNVAGLTFLDPERQPAKPDPVLALADELYFIRWPNRRDSYGEVDGPPSERSGVLVSYEHMARYILDNYEPKG